MARVDVELRRQSYPVFIESGLLSEPEQLRGRLEQYCPTQAMTVVVSNEYVWRLLGDKLRAALGSDRLFFIAIEEGEQAKSIASYYQVISQMLDRGCTRDSRILALGGGIVGDLAGFVAATYMRGINYVQIPTTLLAQVDSSVGGKTAINHELAKNSIGAFKQPRAVIIDPRCLSTLDDRQLRAGIAEIIKYALIGDEGFCQWLEDHMADLLARKTDALEYAIDVSCRAKAAIVAEDELDTGGRRALLNLGHTFGHAIEKLGRFSDWLHGEAVACGMVMAAGLSARRGELGSEEEQGIRALIEMAGLPTSCPPDTDAGLMLAAMMLDKKNTGQEIRLVLLKGVGKAHLTRSDARELNAFIRDFISGEPAPGQNQN